MNINSVIGYLAIINIVTFCLYGMDKSAAVKDKRRIPNRVLLALAAVGGSIGAWIGMYTFKHKTKKWYYTITVPVILILQITLAVLLLSGCGIDTSSVAGSMNQVTETQNEESVEAEDASEVSSDTQELPEKIDIEAFDDEETEALEESNDDITSNYTVYVTKTGDKYHLEGCSYLKSIGGIMTEEEARRAGYEPCSRCID